jgi:hypothetical protein
MALPRALVRDMESYTWNQGTDDERHPSGDAYCPWCHITWYGNMVEPVNEIVYLFEHAIQPAHVPLVHSAYVHLEMQYLPLLHRQYFPEFATQGRDVPLGFVRSVCIRGRHATSEGGARDLREELEVPRRLNQRTWLH